MELRRSRRIQGLPPIEEEVQKKLRESIFHSTYEWAVFVLIAFILPIYYFAAFK